MARLTSRIVLGGLALLLCAPVVAAAQEASPFCFNARPLPECRTFLIADVALGGRLLGTAAPEPQELDQMMAWRVVTEIGLMANRGPRSAIGGSAVVRIGDEVLIWGPRARYRRWLPSGRAWEVSVAALVAAGDERSPGGGVQWAEYDGIGGEVGGAFVLAKWLSVGADLVLMPFDTGEWDASLQPSLRITGPAGLALGLAFGMVAATKPSMSW